MPKLQFLQNTPFTTAAGRRFGEVRNAFGSGMKERTASFGATYKYGFNNQEKEGELGEYYSFEYRVHDARLGRFLSVDPWANKYYNQSVYVFAFNNPVLNIDWKGLGDPSDIGKTRTINGCTEIFTGDEYGWMDIDVSLVDKAINLRNNYLKQVLRLEDESSSDIAGSSDEVSREYIQASLDANNNFGVMSIVKASQNLQIELINCEANKSQKEVFDEKANKIINDLNAMTERLNLIEQNLLANNTSDYTSPCKGTVTSYFYRDNGSFHGALDIANSEGTSILSATPGTVALVGNYPKDKAAYGNIVVIHIGKFAQNAGITAGYILKRDGSYIANDVDLSKYNLFLLYGHLSKIEVCQDQQLQAGEIIGQMGTTGFSTGPHLHFELFIGTGSNQTNLGPFPSNKNYMLDVRNITDYLSKVEK